MAVRTATSTDIEAMVALSEIKRRDYAKHSALFWHKAKDSASKQQLYFEHLLNQSSVIMQVSINDTTLDGFIIASVVSAPPVYDIGGLNCMIDDFCVVDDKLWSTVGHALLDEVSHRAHVMGAVQVVVVTGYHDDPKRNFLQATGLSIASEWYTGSIKSDSN